MLCWCLLLGISVVALEGTIGYFVWKLEYGALAVTIVASVNIITYLMNVIDKCCACKSWLRFKSARMRSSPAFVCRRSTCNSFGYVDPLPQVG